MASRGLLIPPSYLHCIYNTAAVIGVIPVLAGAAGLAQPRIGMQMLQFSTLEDEVSNRKLSHGLFRMYAIRQVFMGLTNLAMWYTGSPQALGLSLLSGTLVAITDGLVSKDVCGRYVIGHLVAVPVSLFMGSALVGLL